MAFERRVRQAPSAPPLKIDRGIEKILRASVKRGGERLAVGGQYAPAYSPMRQRLDQLYAMPNLDDYLIEEMAPAVGEGSLLLPHRFAQGLQAALTLLEREAARDEQKRHARVLQRAIDVLSDQLALRDLLRAYVSALYKG